MTRPQLDEVKNKMKTEILPVCSDLYFVFQRTSKLPLFYEGMVDELF
jgi:hypothetical protein